MVFIIYHLLIYLYVRHWLSAQRKRANELVQERKLHPTDKEEPYVMMHARWRRKGIAALAVFMLGLVLVLILDGRTPIEESTWSRFMVPLAIIIGLSWTPWGMVAEVYGIFIVLDDQGITRLSPWAKERTVKWSDVEFVTYSEFWAWFTIRTPKGGTHVTTVICGLEKFAHAMISHVPNDKIHIPNGVVDRALRGPFR